VEKLNRTITRCGNALLAEALALEEDARESESKLALARTVVDTCVFGDPVIGRQGATPLPKSFCRGHDNPLSVSVTVLAPRLLKEAELCR